MKSVKEIKDFNDKYRYMAINAQNTQNLNQFVFDVLIGITEHLEAQSVRSDDTIRREGRIEGLQAAATAAALTSDMHMLRQRLAITITRLENGGDL